MKNMGIVRGSKESAIPFEICVDTVYIRLNIVPVEPEEGDDDMGGIGVDQYEYHEIQYALAEWLQIVTEATIDTASITPNAKLIKGLEEMTLDRQISIEESGITAIVAFDMAYIGLPEQKPFTFATKFTQRRTT